MDGNGGGGDAMNERQYHREVRSSHTVREKREKKKTNHIRVWVPRPRIGHLAFGANLWEEGHLPFSSPEFAMRCMHKRACKCG
jgi:hypothetical protein